MPAEDAAQFKATPATQAESLVGTFIGEYLVLGRLGRGGFGRVLLGLQRPHFKLRAAIKLLETDGVEASLRRGMLEKFDNEAQALAMLRHPNIVSLLRFGRLAGEPFLAMELVPGARTLSSVTAAREGTPFEPSVVQRIVDQLLRGLDVAHRAGIIHRDLKPDNVMLEEIDGDPWHLKIVDFGLAKDYRLRQETSVVVGTLAYMAPEQLACIALGPWTDLYAVAVLAFELITGRYLFDGSQLEMMRQKSEPFARADVAEVIATLPARLQKFFARALAADPKRRFRTVAELRAAFVGATATLDASPRDRTTEPVFFGELAARPSRLRGRTAIALFAGIIAVAGTGAAILAASGEPPPTAQALVEARILGPSADPPRKAAIVAAAPAVEVARDETAPAAPVAAPPSAPVAKPAAARVESPPRIPGPVSPKVGTPRAASPKATREVAPPEAKAAAVSPPDDLPVVHKHDAGDLMTVKKADAARP